MYLHWFHCTLKDPCTFPVMAPLFSPLTRTQIRSAVQCFTLSRIPSALPTPQKRSFRNTFASTLAAIRLTVTGLDSGLCNPAGWKKGKGFCARQVILQWELKNLRLTASNYSRCLQNRSHQSLGYNMQYDPRTDHMWSIMPRPRPVISCNQKDFFFHCDLWRLQCWGGPCVMIPTYGFRRFRFAQNSEIQSRQIEGNAQENIKKMPAKKKSIDSSWPCQWSRLY